MSSSAQWGSDAAPVALTLPDDVVRTPDGLPAVLLVRTARGWTPLDVGAVAHDTVGRPLADPAPAGGLPLVEAMTLADLVAEEAGTTPEPGRHARLAARTRPAPAGPADDPRDAEIAALRRTVGQLEHALAARVSIERAIGVLAERHGTPPRESFDELRRLARAQGRPAQDLAREVLDGLTPPAVPAQRAGEEPVPEQQTTPVTALPGPAAPTPHGEPDRGVVPRPPTARRVTRHRARQSESPGMGAEAHN